VEDHIGNENVLVQVWDWTTSAWATRMTDQSFDRSLASSEVSGGTVMVRFVDHLTPGAPSANSLRVDSLVVVKGVG